MTVRADTLRLAGPACAHCGLEVPARRVQPEAAHQFCCTGCEQVHGILAAWGAEDYYRLAADQRAQLAPARPSGRAFQDFDDAGFQAEHVRLSGRGTHTIRLYLEGVHCAACVWLLEDLPRRMPGLLSVRLNLASAQARIEWDPAQVPLSAIARALDSVGYIPHAWRVAAAEEGERREDRTLLIRLGVAVACALNIMVLQAALYAGEAHGIDAGFVAFFRWLGLVLALPVVLFSARPFYRTAWAGLRQRVPHIDLPIALALTVAFTYSAINTLRGEGAVWFDSLSALVALLLAARFVQRRAQRAAIERAHSLRGAAFAEYARRLDPAVPGAPFREVPVEALSVGDHVEVRSGELVPVDGTVLHGRSALDNAVLTGEPEPVPVREGGRVYAGATNVGARLVVRVEAAGADTRVGALLRLVEDAMAQRPPLVQAADRLSRWFVMGVLALAAATVAIWIGDSPAAALEHAVALLVVTCPCALGLATPVAMSVGLARAARAGIFITSPDAIELLRHVDTMLLDKTGTLTEGAATVQGWQGDAAALELALDLESESSHPVARALRRSYPRAVRPARPVTDVREVPGEGIAGRVDGRAVAVGTRRFLERAGIAVGADPAAQADTLVGQGLSPVYVAVDGVVAGIAGVGDTLRSEAVAIVAALRSRGIRPIIVSGDHPSVVRRMGAALGIPAADAHGGMTPEGKRDFVEHFRASGRPGRGVAMVGDGVNDAAAMALADVGIAVHGGAGASIVAADVVLTRPGLRPLLDLVRGGRRLLGIVHRNLLFSLIYNVAGAALAVVGWVGPLLAAVLMPLSSLTVILSSALGRTFVAVPGAARPARHARAEA